MVSGTRRPIPITPEAQFAEWQNYMEYRTKALEAGPSDKKGIVAYQTPITANSTTWTVDSTTDFALSGVVVDSSRLYIANLFTQYNTGGAASWVVNFHVDGTLTDRFYFINVGAATRDHIWARMLWLPTTGTKNLDVRVDNQSGASLVFEAAAGNTRQFWIEDDGLR